MRVIPTLTGDGSGRSPSSATLLGNARGQSSATLLTHLANQFPRIEIRPGSVCLKAILTRSFRMHTLDKSSCRRSRVRVRLEDCTHRTVHHDGPGLVQARRTTTMPQAPA